MPITDADLDNWFSYHPPKKGQAEQCEVIRQVGKEFARTIVSNTLPCANQTAAIRKVREAVMTANAAIACGGK
jgi:hypothetical protein